jgi:hypothetical protein
VPALQSRQRQVFAGEQSQQATKRHKRTNDMAPRQMLTRQKGGEDHDQQRPEMIDEAGFRRRRRP